MNLFYLFALQWNHLTGNHTIHGLWPQFSEHKWPEYCSHTIFNKTVIQDLIPTLNIIWPSIESRHIDVNECNVYDNLDFWKHEWLRHGTCNYNHLDEYHYFTKVIDLYNQYGLEYKCHPHTPCFIKFDTSFQIME
jgi:ribonuclease T2